MSLYVETRGRGPVLVLLHGWGLNLHIWDTFAKELESSFRLLLIDLPGHGRSEWHERGCTLDGQAQWIAETLQTWPVSNGGIGKIAVLGWSLGGQLALRLAASSFGACIDALALIATTPRFTGSESWVGMSSSALDDFASRLARDYRRTVRDFLELQVRGSADGESALKTLHATLLEHGEADARALECGLRILAETDLRPQLPQIRQRALVVAGRNDRVTLPPASRALAAGLQNAQYIEISRAAHAPFLSHPREFAQHLLGFLAESRK